MILAIDMDGTIVDFKTKFKENIKKLYGIECDEGYVNGKTVYKELDESIKKKYKSYKDIYDDVCAEGFFIDLDPYPGAIDAINELYEYGHEIIFLTKVLNWKRSASEKAIWLNKHLGNIKYKTIMVDHVSCKHIVEADLIVDDDSRILEGVYIPKICIAQPWNKEYRENSVDDYNLMIAESFVEAKDIILTNISPVFDEWEESYNI